MELVIKFWILNVLYSYDLIKISPSNLLLFCITYHLLYKWSCLSLLPLPDSKLLSFLPSVNFVLPEKTKQHKNCYMSLLFRMLQVHHLIINVQKIIQHSYTLQSQYLEVSGLCFSCRLLMGFSVSWCLTSFTLLRFLPPT